MLSDCAVVRSCRYNLYAVLAVKQGSGENAKHTVLEEVRVCINKTRGREVWFT